MNYNYISDLPEFQAPEILRGKVILLSAGTGAGKSTAVIGLAQNPAFMKGGRMLFLTTRRADKRKLDAKTGGIDTITVRTIQDIESNEIERDNVDIDRYFDSFTCVVCDEAHYWVTDSKFSSSSILSLNAVRAYADKIVKGADKTLILISATPEKLDELVLASEITIEKRTDHIGAITFLPSGTYVHHVVREILKARETGRKGLCFFKKKRDIERVRTMLEAEGVTDAVDVYTAGKGEEILPNENGEYEVAKTVLCTSVLAFGIDINNVDFVASDETDPLLLIQELGRKRCRPGEKVTYYIADYSAAYLGKIYAPEIARLTDSNEFVADPDTYLSAPHSDGGRWRTRHIENNPALYITRSGEIEKNIAFATYCERLKEYSTALNAGTTTWRQMVLTRMGFTDTDIPPVVDYQTIIDADVRTELDRLAKNPAPTTDDWRRVGMALRVTNKGSRLNKYGAALSSPAALSKHIEPYGFKAGKAKQKRENGKVIRFYPLERM